MTEKVDVNMTDEIKKDTEEQQRKKEINAEDKKKSGLFVLICILSGFVGGIFGASIILLVNILESMGLSFTEFWMQAQKDFTLPASFLMIGLDLLFFTIALTYYLKGKKIWNSNMEEDEKYEKADQKLSLSILYSNVLYYVSFAFYGFAMYASISIAKETNDGAFNSALRMGVTGIFIVVLFAGLAIQRACVNLTKLMNPEKKGSVYDVKFDKVWYESCDEAERMQIGIAGYKTVKVINMTILALFVIFVCLGMFFEIGILPIVVLLILALVVNITYGITAMKAGAGSVGGNSNKMV